VKVEYLDESARSMKKVTLSLYSIFQEKTDDLCHSVDGYEENGYAEAEMTMFYPPDYQMDDKSADYFFKASHPKGEKEIESERITLPYKRKKITVPWIFDCHMHINSGHCSPLPLSKVKAPIPIVGQKGLDVFSSVALGNFGSIQKLPTDEIGNLAIEASKEVLEDPDLFCLGTPEKRRRVMIGLPMNMDFAHYRGYEGRPIYENVNGKMMWWDEKEGEFKSVGRRNVNIWESYKKQVNLTKNAFYNAKGALLPLYHYDPRANLGDWNAPFDKNLIQTALSSSFPENLPAIGIKMYTALGYKPMDPKLKFPWDEYYGLCERNQIPIICHCSKGGMIAHDMEAYFNHENPENTKVLNNFKQSWFNREFISPHAWEPVLKRHNNLYLCLAHFGGEEFWDKSVKNYVSSYWNDLNDRDPENWIAEILYLMKTYPNFYVDISYFLFKDSFGEFFKKALAYDPVVKERILFGTDWWLVTTKGFLKGYKYRDYVENICRQILFLNEKEFLKSIGINDPKELLAYFMTLNPMRFMQLKKLAPKLSTIFYLDRSVLSRKLKFELDDWIKNVPDKIEDFYQ
jgi:predicted TIM-barrel fold metal-dependent hydrolase